MLKQALRKPEIYLYPFAAAVPISFASWQALINNFSIEQVGFGGIEIGILQRLREVLGFLAFGVVFLFRPRDYLRDAGEPGRSGTRPPLQSVIRQRLRRQPRPATSTSIRSPDCSQTGGSRKAPTPWGVPVAMTSPGSRVNAWLRYCSR